MRLADLIHDLDVQAVTPAAGDIRVCDITEDSRTVLPGSLFVARGGAKSDGRKYVTHAIAAGASVILSDTALDLGPHPHGAVMLVARDVPGVTAAIAERFYGNPSSKLHLIGVTGTNGKTTIAFVVHQLLNAAKKRCGLISTVLIDDGREKAEASMTTPPSIELSQIFSTMIDEQCEAAAMEVSSHSLDQKRVAALLFNTAIFTNLTGDHLDYHKTMDAYADAKAILFASLPTSGLAIVNVDDAWSSRMLKGCKARIIRCTAKEVSGADARVRGGRATMSGTDATFEGPWGRIDTTIPLVGTHNLMNVLQSIAAAHDAGLSAGVIQRLLPYIEAPPGRLERVRPARGDADPGFAVFVDYAHTDDALANVLRTARPLVESGGKLRVVFGCGGDRDRTKRPRMAKVACELADDVVITSDNPRTEDPHAIIREITAGVGAHAAKVHTDADRRKAIEHAVQVSKPGDIVVIAGKGHETYQLLPDGKGGILRTDFDDRIEAARALAHRDAASRHAHIKGVTLA